MAGVGTKLISENEQIKVWEYHEILVELKEPPGSRT